jgi:hypothetical protein
METRNQTESIGEETSRREQEIYSAMNKLSKLCRALFHNSVSNNTFSRIPT